MAQQWGRALNFSPQNRNCRAKNPVSFGPAERVSEELNIAKYPDGSPYYTLMPDGDRILYLEMTESGNASSSTSRAELVVADNWITHVIDATAP